MSSALENKQIVLGITGAIAAYKSADLVRRLREVGARVQVVMTENAQQFISPLTLQALSGLPVRTSLFDPAAEAAMGHIELARWADLILVAPASADLLARLAGGRADDLLTTLCLATRAPILLAPAMNQAMWKHKLTQKNLQVLQELGIHFAGPAEGSQACGDVGPGRMSEPEELVRAAASLFKTEDLRGLRFLITAGPTQEALDPVRYLSNASSGKMGYALAQAAVAAGASVTLVSGPVKAGLSVPSTAEVIPVVSAQEMYEAVMQRVANCDIFLSVAAVADYRAKIPTAQKLAKQPALHLELERTPDVITEVAKQNQRPFIVGFAAETEQVVEKAQEKRIRKGMDVVIANQVGKGLGFDSDENAVTVLWQDAQEAFARTSKTELAKQLVPLIAKLYKQGRVS